MNNVTETINKGGRFVFDFIDTYDNELMIFIENTTPTVLKSIKIELFGEGSDRVMCAREWDELLGLR